MPTDLLIPLRVSKRLLGGCVCVHLLLFVLIQHYGRIEGFYLFWLTIVGCVGSLLWSCRSVVRNRVYTLSFEQHRSSEEEPYYLSYLVFRSREDEKQLFQLLGIWQFFSGVFLLQCRLCDRRRYYWCLLLPDSFLYPDQLRQLVWVLRFGRFRAR